MKLCSIFFSNSLHTTSTTITTITTKITTKIKKALECSYSYIKVRSEYPKAFFLLQLKTLAGLDAHRSIQMNTPLINGCEA